MTKDKSEGGSLFDDDNLDEGAESASLPSNKDTEVGSLFSKDDFVEPEVKATPRDVSNHGVVYPPGRVRMLASMLPKHPRLLGDSQEPAEAKEEEEGKPDDHE
jgi:hypothetical protein